MLFGGVVVGQAGRMMVEVVEVENVEVVVSQPRTDPSRSPY